MDTLLPQRGSSVACILYRSHSTIFLGDQADIVIAFFNHLIFKKSVFLVNCESYFSKTSELIELKLDELCNITSITKKTWVPA